VLFICVVEADVDEGIPEGVAFDVVAVVNFVAIGAVVGFVVVLAVVVGFIVVVAVVVGFSCGCVVFGCASLSNTLLPINVKIQTIVKY
jgi:hypothetical protein